MEHMEQEVLKPSKRPWRVKVTAVMLGLVAVAVLFGLVAPSLIQYTKGEVVELEGRPGRAAGDRMLTVDKGVSVMLRASCIQVTWGRNTQVVSKATAAPRKLSRLPLSKVPGTTEVPPEFWVISGTRGFAGFGFLIQSPETVEGVRRMAVSVPTWFLALVAIAPGAHYYWRRRKSMVKAKAVKAMKYAV
jgi:hypothetical protein